jgi:hypothetical protein
MARFIPVASLLAAAFVITPDVAVAQTASPANAGQNAGNNPSASSLTTFSTPNFSRPVQIPIVEGVTVDPNGSLEATPEDQDRLRESLETAVRRNLPSLQPPLIASLTTIPIASAAGPSTAVFNDRTLTITVNGELLELPASKALRSYVDQAIRAGFTPASLSLGAQLVSIGAPVDPTLELTASLQDLAVQPTVNVLAKGISAFNVIVNGASPALRAQLNRSPVFIAASNTLRTARNAFPDKR